MSNQPVEIPQIQNEEEHKVSDVSVPQQKTEAQKKREQRKIYKRNLPHRKFQRIIHELNQEWKGYLKISGIDALTIKTFKKRITDEKFKEFLSSIKKKLEENDVTLTYLNLNLRNCRKLTSDSIETLISHLGTTFKNLEYFNLNLTNIYKIEEAIVELIKNIGLQLTNLQHLILDLNYTWNGDRVEILTEYVLSNLPRLKTFRVKNAFNYVSKEKSIVEFIQVLTRNHPQLEDLELDFNTCTLSDSAFSEIARELSDKLPNLKRFSVKADGYSQLSENSIINLFRVTGPSLNKLESLEASFKSRRKNHITDHVVESLANKFNDHFHGLKNLVLIFEGASKLTNEGVSKLIKSIGTNLKNLKNLELNLNGLWNLDDEIIKFFAFLNNDHLPELESLKLSVAGAKFTNQGVKDFLASFEGKSNNLKELTLDFSGCKSLSENGIKYLASHIPQVFKNLKKLKLILRNHKQTVTPKVRAHLMKSLKSISKVEILVGSL